ncbi:MAG TPA: thiamine ABC transporter substrate binding subunit [Candidatus Cloacimonadota bacterium]|nr:thiamine ABC transporter substrate binding subunit [Candidatus Cloacimonadales bacterium]HOE90647.1 thiamine ABC transporter substrate binding subunit [Candidatus Cloacimonadota bacterium]HOQ80613.1 thiamine ABC transporter substrate binding subunit [Candidatus Cloacimonadota bacterium]HPY96785.1 thiamine ABC transporter substrate binding subunit [Candidatus Cloacimonadota bacterium]HQB41413.1 thiamine ABC transporter substrate binding subunit [Candidatus Cloacimonadota bacterium]
MKKIILIMLVLSTMLFACSKKSADGNGAAADSVLTIYSYDSFASWGLGKEAIPEFERQNNCRVIMITAGDAGEILNRLILEKDQPVADVAIGIDNTFLLKAIEHDVFQTYKPNNLSLIDQNTIFDTTFHLTPYDYGYFAFVYDSKKIKKVPKSFEELLSSNFKEKIILIDPRTSSPGKGLFLWSMAAFGEDGFEDFWKRIKPKVLTITSSWDEAYTAFLAGEVNMVLSYASSPAFHYEEDKSTRYQAFIPSEGGFKQVEGAGIVKNCNNPELAKKFIEYMLTEDFQKHVPLTQWMYPVLPTVTLPEGFKYCPLPTHDLESPKSTDYFEEQWINKWLDIMTK